MSGNLGQDSTKHSASAGTLLIAGNTSDAGKSLVVTGLCRALLRRGISVAPFKAQNMSNNSAVCSDGGEIGRAQALQAEAAAVSPTVDLNPVLLKPGSDRTSQVLVRGVPHLTVGAADYHQHRGWLAEVVDQSLERLRQRYDAVICEGAGSPAEINLRATDLANFGLAQRHRMPVAVVGDIDRGGVLAHFLGTLAIVDPADQDLLCAFIVNKFRGDRTLLEPGLRMVSERTGRPIWGVLPYLDQLWIDAEDSLASAVGTTVGRPRPPVGQQWLFVAAIRLPRVSNSTDVEALACEPGVRVLWTDSPADVAAADVVIIPGTKATVSDLEWLGSRSLDQALTVRAQAGRPIFGICGGFQMLGRSIVDGVESASPTRIRGLELLDMDIVFSASKTVREVAGVVRIDSFLGGGVAGSEEAVAISGYEIHHGQVQRCDESPLLSFVDGRTEGANAGVVSGTHWHGLLANDIYRRAWLTRMARLAKVPGFTPAVTTEVKAIREGQIDLIADAVEEHIDMNAVLRCLDNGVSPGLPRLASELNNVPGPR